MGNSRGINSHFNTTMLVPNNDTGQTRPCCIPVDFPHKFMDLYGRRNGFIFLLLRFFLCMNSGVNLFLGLDEFLALVAMVVGRVDESWYQALALTPSVRSVTLASWFQVSVVDSVMYSFSL